MNYTKLIATLAVATGVMGSVGVSAQAAVVNHHSAVTSQQNNMQKAVDAVNALFADANHTKLADGVTRAQINNAKKLVLKYVSVSTGQLSVLFALCTKAENMLNAAPVNPNVNPKVQAAIDAVNALFADANHTALAAGVNDVQIKAATKLVMKNVPLSSVQFKTLSALCMKATELLNNSTTATDSKTQVAVDAVNALFTDASHTKLAKGVTRTKILEVSRLILKNVSAASALFRTLTNLCAQALILL